jgi:hypothetical protein
MYCLKHYRVSISQVPTDAKAEQGLATRTATLTSVSSNVSVSASNEIARESLVRTTSEKPDWLLQKEQQARQKEADMEATRRRFAAEEAERAAAKLRENEEKAKNLPALEMMRGAAPDPDTCLEPRATAIDATTAETPKSKQFFVNQPDTFRRLFARFPTELLAAIFTSLVMEKPTAISAFVCACREMQPFLVHNCANALMPIRYAVASCCEIGERCILSRWEGGGDGACYEHYYSYGHRYSIFLRPCQQGRFPPSLTLNVRWVPKDEAKILSEKEKKEKKALPAQSSDAATTPMTAEENSEAERWRETVDENGEVLTRGLRWKFIWDGRTKQFLWHKQHQAQEAWRDGDVSKRKQKLEYYEGFEPSASAAWGNVKLSERRFEIQCNLKLLSQPGCDEQLDRYTHVEMWATSGVGGLSRDSRPDEKMTCKLFPRHTRRHDDSGPCFDGGALIRLVDRSEEDCDFERSEVKEWSEATKATTTTTTTARKIPISECTLAHRLYHPAHPRGLAIRRIVKTHVPGGSRLMVNLHGASGGACWVTRGHPVWAPIASAKRFADDASSAATAAICSENLSILGGSDLQCGGGRSDFDWFRADKLLPSVERRVEFVYNFELEAEDEVVVGDEKETICCTLGMTLLLILILIHLLHFSSSSFF